AEHVILDRLPGVDLLHQRHVLVGGGVEHDLWAVLAQYPLHAGGVARVAYGADDRQLLTVLAEFLFDLIQGILRELEQDQPSWGKARDLTAQFGADRTPGASYEHGLARKESSHPLRVEDHWVASKKVVELHLSQLGDRHLAGDDVVKGWDRHHLESGLCGEAD